MNELLAELEDAERDLVRLAAHEERKARELEALRNVIELARMRRAEAVVALECALIRRSYPRRPG